MCEARECGLVYLYHPCARTIPVDNVIILIQKLVETVNRTRPTQENTNVTCQCLVKLMTDEDIELEEEAGNQT